MKKNYFISAALFLGAAALVSPVQADAQGGWRNMNHLLKNVSQAEGWSGMLTDAQDGVGEFFPGAGMVYQVVRDLPAGEYTLTANAFYRNGAAPEASKKHFANKETKNAFIFINNTTAQVKSLFDKEGITEAALWSGTEYQWGKVPNGLPEAKTDFDAGHYLNTVTANHPGGDMVIGFKYLGMTEGQMVVELNNWTGEGKVNHGDTGSGDGAEWCAFGNFKLKGPNGDVALAADGKFADFKGKDDGWDVRNVSNGNKGRGLQNGCVFSKTNASPYNHSQTLTNMPAGKYRVVIQSFNQHFLGAHSGYFIPMKGDFYLHEGKSSYDLYKENATEYVRGQVSEGNVPTATVKNDGRLEAYVYINEGEKKGTDGLNPETEKNEWLEDYTDPDHPENNYKAPRACEVKIKNLFEENLDEYPEVQNYKMSDGKWKWVTTQGDPAWFESGHMREVAAFFIANPNLYQNSAELEFTGDNNTFTVGYHKDLNQNNYANPVFDFRLEYWDPTYTGYDVTGGSGVADIIVDENAPVEYYNLQGIRVANPENGLYIVKQGNKVTKRIIK